MWYVVKTNKNKNIILPKYVFMFTLVTWCLAAMGLLSVLVYEFSF